MKLELKHLAPYLPYKLMVLIDDIISGYEEKYCFMIGLTNALIIIDSCEEIEYEFVKPILRPLSDLTKEIEINGEKFVPIVELLKIFSPYDDYYSRYGLIEYEKEGLPRAYYTYRANHEIVLYPYDIDNMPYWIIQKLFEWHFDLVELIKEGLAIDINTL